jgi:hypothetical protein
LGLEQQLQAAVLQHLARGVAQGHGSFYCLKNWLQFEIRFIFITKIK